MKIVSNPEIAIIGYGSMGKEIEKIAISENIIVSNIFDLNNPISKKENYSFDVGIDFTYPDTVIKNVMLMAEMNKSIVLGTTGWYEDKEKIREIVEKNNIGLVWGSNFSIGMQLFFKMVAYSSQLFNSLDNYDVFAHELHHVRKKDSPSGTSISIANAIMNNFTRKTELLTETMHGTIKPQQLHSTSSRGGEIVGTHTVYIDSFADTIELTHRAKNRSGFALGAVLAAKWVNGKKGMFEFSDVVDEIIAL